MAISDFVFLNQAKLKVARGEIDLDTDSFSFLLCDDTQALAVGFAGTSTEALYADLTGELATAGGYTNGGVAVTNPSVSIQSDQLEWTMDDLFIAALTATFKYVVLIDTTHVDDPIVGYWDVDVGGSGFANAGTDYYGRIDASGVLRF